jgi:hypothetical protein
MTKNAVLEKKKVLKEGIRMLRKIKNAFRIFLLLVLMVGTSISSVYALDPVYYPISATLDKPYIELTVGEETIITATLNFGRTPIGGVWTDSYINTVSWKVFGTANNITIASLPSKNNKASAKITAKALGESTLQVYSQNGSLLQTAEIYVKQKPSTPNYPVPPSYPEPPSKPLVGVDFFNNEDFEYFRARHGATRWDHLSTGIRSLRVSQNYRVILCREAGYKGTFTVFENRQSSLYEIPYLDYWPQGSSIIVQYIPHDPAYPTIYKDSAFQTWHATLTSSEYRYGSELKQLGIGNDEVTSLFVPAGYEVTLYEHDNFGGASKTARGPLAVPHLNDFDNKTSSIRIRKVIPPLFASQGQFTYKFNSINESLNWK